MFCVYSLPWFCKGAIIAYDVFTCLLLRKDTNAARAPGVVADAIVSVFCLQTMIAVLLLTPSVCLSVADRVQTNTFCANTLLLMSLFFILIRGLREGIVSIENACFCLQFCSCYQFSCFFETSRKSSKLLLGSSVIRLASGLSMILFPVLYTHMLQDCMHVSPYALAFVFCGEVFGCISFCLSYLICAFECVVNAICVRLAESLF